jgi:hypothetical protein
MATCGNDRLLFLHVPKTGGSWVSKAMAVAGIDVAGEATELPHPELDDVDRGGRFTFAFVREPFAWYGSYWQYRRKRGLPRQEHPSTWADLPFADYIWACTVIRPGSLGRYFERFVGSPDAPIDFIGRFESLSEDLVRALGLAGQEYDKEALRAVPPVNRSSPPPPCPPEIRDELIRAEREVYERFYEVDGLRPSGRRARGLGEIARVTKR